MNQELYKDVIVLMSAIISIVITIINSLCIYVILTTKKLREKPPMIFIVNLLVTYLLQGVFVVPAYAVYRSGDYSESSFPYICDVWRLTYMITFYVMCVNVLLIAIDRLLATKYALSRKIRLTSERCKILCCLAWLYIILLCLIPFVPLKRSKSLENSKCHYNQPREWSIFMLLVNSALPLALNLGIYVYIARTMKQNSKVLFGQQKKHSQAAIDRMALNRKLTTLTVKITLLYGVTWIPSIVYYNRVHSAFFV